ncbi:MAG: VIT family protein [Acidobacteria bacterium]|nr:MAG: VIT family protein [Acidobacteriota bacterium]
MRPVHLEGHRSSSTSWLRAAVLGANDGLISTSSLVVGVASAGMDASGVIVSALAGMVAGALSMAAGEYVSVSSQADVEGADLARETRELKEDPDGEFEELAAIYVGRGLSPALAHQVATEFTAKDALTTHLRDELGITDLSRARPLQAAIASALAFCVGAALPVIVAAAAPLTVIPTVVTGASLVMLAGLGGVAARLGRAPMGKGALRVVFWGAVAMGVTALIGKVFGTTI